MIRFLLAGLVGVLIYAAWAALSLSGLLTAGPLFGLVSGGLVTAVLAAVAGQVIGAYHHGQAKAQSTPQADSASPIKQSTPLATPPARVTKPVRSEAIMLLATLQREARFVDLVHESLTDYSDAQVGAAARDVLRDCRAVLDRFFDLQPVVNQPEGTSVEIPVGQAAGRYRMTGTDQAGSSGAGSSDQGTVVHHGWEARQCQLPQWSGSDELALVIAPAELEKS
jgi:hypothetical protein